MRVQELFEDSGDRPAKREKVHIVTKHGELVAHHNREIEEDHPNYLPKGVDPNKVVELSTVEIKPKFIGKGYGTILMDKFLNTPLAKNADLIFLDLNDGMRPARTEMEEWSDEKYLKYLRTFYKKFGFVDGNECPDRMWKIVNAKIKKSDLP